MRNPKTQNNQKFQKIRNNKNPKYFWPFGISVL